jgi:hypothetical protein
MREPPPEWYLAGYFEYKPPESATRRKSDLPEKTWSKAIENTLAIGRMMGIDLEVSKEKDSND